ncbi:MAG: hypothetical protein EA411_07595 [Saprospirales bacterium]|nr:MAG: hypothetical protein EA411_07595 [Saprospirales bacterium]
MGKIMSPVPSLFLAGPTSIYFSYSFPKFFKHFRFVRGELLGLHKLEVVEQLLYESCFILTD